MKKMKLNEEQVKNIVYESVKKIISEGLFHRTYREGKPNSASDVIKGNGWDGRVVNKTPSEITIRVYHNSDAVFGQSAEQVLPFEELIQDLNIYYEDKGAKCRAFGSEEFNGKSGSYITIKK